MTVHKKGSILWCFCHILHMFFHCWNTPCLLNGVIASRFKQVVNVTWHNVFAPDEMFTVQSYSPGCASVHPHQTQFLTHTSLPPEQHFNQCSHFCRDHWCANTQTYRQTTKECMWSGIKFIWCTACCYFISIVCWLPSVLWHCWLGIRNSIQSVKIEWWCVGLVICLQWGADCLNMVQLMPLPSLNPIISCII